MYICRYVHIYIYIYIYTRMCYPYRSDRHSCMQLHFASSLSNDAYYISHIIRLRKLTNLGIPYCIILQYMYIYMYICIHIFISTYYYTNSTIIIYVSILYYSIATLYECTILLHVLVCCNIILLYCSIMLS